MQGARLCCARELQRIFDAHNVNNRVTFEYDTRVYYGQLN